MDAFKGVDFMKMDALLDEEERMTRDAVRQWVEERVVPDIDKHFMAETFPTELIPEMGEMGFLGTTIEGYGCLGANSVVYGLIMQELERGDSGLRSFCSVQGALCMYPIYAWGTEEQRERYLPGMAKGQIIGCFGLTEPDFGSNPGGMITRAEDKGDHWVLNGAKMWITNGCVADIAIVWAKVKDRIMGFLVPTDTPGFSTVTQKKKFSLKASITSELVLEDVKLPKDALLPGTEEIGIKGPLSCLTQARYGIAWGAIGAGMACYDAALQYGLERIQWGRPIAGFQLYQRKLAEMVTEITKAQFMNLQLGRLKDKGEMHPSMVSMAKRNACYWALEIAREARDMLGANGITHEYVVGRHMLNLESVKTYEGTHDIHSLIIGQRVTGLAAYEG